MKAATALVAALLALTACSSNTAPEQPTEPSTPTVTEQPPAETEPETTCTEADPAQVDAILQGLNTDGIGLTDTYTVPNPDSTDTIWLAAHLTGSGVDGTEVAYLTGTGNPSWGPIAAAGAVSATFFDWPDAADLYSDGAQTALDCLP